MLAGWNKRWWALLAVCLVWAACSPSRQSATPTGGEQIDLRCHYLYDEKYAADQADGALDAWLSRVVAEVRPSADFAGRYDLFSHQGGGPLGSEWNSDGAIVVMALVPWQENAVQSKRLLLNGKVWKNAPVQKSAGDRQCWFWVIPASDWMAALRPIKRADYPKIYTPELMQYAQPAPQGPLGVGKLLAIRLEVTQVGSRSATWTAHAFHWVQGE